MFQLTALQVHRMTKRTKHFAVNFSILSNK
uniref:Uncharacterized protein n=1 Tax=Rhizophora mucronata TaxID=61149 RepID=A0A2P2QJR3_RHIMU